MAGEIIGSARFVANRIRSRVAGRFAIAISKTDHRGRRIYDVYYSDSQKTDSYVPHTLLERVKRQWSTGIPLTGRAILLADKTLFIAGTPVKFPPDDLSGAYDGRMGGVLWAASAEDGQKLAEYKLDAPPSWDSLAAADGKLFLCTQDGYVHCFE